MEEFEKAVKAGTFQITVVECTTHSGAIVEPGTVITVEKDNVADSRYLMGLGKAVMGDQSAAFKAQNAAANKAVGAADLKTK